MERELCGGAYLQLVLKQVAPVRDLAIEAKNLELLLRQFLFKVLSKPNHSKGDGANSH